MAIVLLFQTHGQLTTAQLAEMLEISERTIRRDLDALLAAGLPLYAQRGRGGGWALVGGHRIDMSGLTVDEARALFLVGGAAGGLGLRSALRKVMAALPEPLRAEAAAAEAATHVDPARWGGRADEQRALPALRDAVVSRVQVDIDYAKPGGRPERRRVHPYGLVSKAGTWYLMAGTDTGRRTFRVSRVMGVGPAGEAADVPEGFDLAREWAEAERAFAETMAVVDVDIEVTADAVLRVTAALRGWVRVTELETGADGWRRLRASFPHADAAAWTLAPYGGLVRVIGPGRVRKRLLEIGEGLVAANSTR